MKTKDDFRLERSINRLYAELDKMLSNSQSILVRQEREFERYCEENNLIYSPKYF